MKDDPAAKGGKTPSAPIIVELMDLGPNGGGVA
jgi:hypothetical protein